MKKMKTRSVSASKPISTSRSVSASKPVSAQKSASVIRPLSALRLAPAHIKGLFILFMCLVFLSGCSFFQAIEPDNQEETREHGSLGSLSQINQEESDEPDWLGSWSQINQVVERGEDWQQIVVNSPFQLGEKTYSRSWETNNGTMNAYSMEYGTYPSIDGSTVVVPMAVEFARQHLGLTDEYANGLVGFSTTHLAYYNLITKDGNRQSVIVSYTNRETIFLDSKHPVDLIIATEPSEDELALAEQHWVTLITKPVCYDAFVFITHKDNPVDSLTLDQIRGIYSGQITNWKELGGEDKAIVAYQREENSGSQTAMINLVMKDNPMLPPETVKVAEGMGYLVDVVAEYQNNATSIGYTYRYYIDNLYKNEDIKILKIDGISSDEGNLRTEAYPLTVCYYGIIRAGDEGSSGGLFLEWMLTEEGQKCIQQAGYIPYYEFEYE